MENLKNSNFLILQIFLIAFAQNIASSEKNHTIATREINDATEVSNDIRKVNENSTTITSADKNETVITNVTEKIETSTPLIPPATVEAQIEKLDVTSKKPSRVQIVAAQ